MSNNIFTIYGPPGTGKTTELLRLLEVELRTYSPEEIAYVSFTKEGSEQGKNRAIQAFGFNKDRFIHFRTLHSAAFHSLGLSREQVISKNDYKKFSDIIGMKFTGYYTEELKHDDDLYLFVEELYRNNPSTAKLYLNNMDISKWTYVRKHYAEFKKKKYLYDYTDMIEKFIKEGKSIPVKIAFVDEAQDLTSLQWKMVWTAFKDCDRIYIAGDDDQAIYQWSGADVKYFLSIEGTSTILRHSYRLPDSVLRFAKRISSQISSRIDKPYEGRGVEGLVETHNSLSTIPIKEKQQWLFLVRNRTFIPKIEKFLQEKVLVYTSCGEPSVTKEEIELIKLYEKVRSTSMMTMQEELKLKKHLLPNYNLRNEWYISFNWKEEKKAYLRDIIRKKVSYTNSQIRIGTIHSSKGSESDNVVLLLDVTKTVADNIRNNPDSEHRAFYVGATRAKEALHIVYGEGRHSYPIY